MPANCTPMESLEQRRLLSASLPPIHIPGTDTTLLVPLFAGPGAGPVTRQGPVNGDFSASPDFSTGWQTTGNEFVQAADFHTIPDGKTTQAVLSNAQVPNGGALPTSAANVETFLNLTAAALSSAAKVANNGSAIKQNVTGKSGDIITFKADFLTDEAVKGGAGDYAFVTVTLNGKTQLFKLTGALKASNILDSHGLANETGYHSYAILLPRNGTYTLGYGIVNVGDTAVASDLLVDNVQLKPHVFDFGDLFEHFGDFGGDHDGKHGGGHDGGDDIGRSLFGNGFKLLN